MAINIQIDVMSRTVVFTYPKGDEPFISYQKDGIASYMYARTVNCLFVASELRRTLISGDAAFDNGQRSTRFTQMRFAGETLADTPSRSRQTSTAYVRC